MTSGLYEIIGVESSPYTIKVRAVMRYWRLPHVWLCRMPQFYPPCRDVRPLIMPVVRFPDGSMNVDSTPILLGLDARPGNERSILPDDPVQALFARLIEDMADEWLTKCLFHYRFSYAPDRAFAPLWVMDDAHPDIDRAALAEMTAAFLDRQTERMAAVGATAENAPVIEASYRRVLEILEPFCALDRFLFGSRPSLADFGLYAQLKTLAIDPTPAAIVRQSAPRTENWVRRADDLSGVDGGWQQSETAQQAVAALLAMVGDTYLPFLAANANAVAAADAIVDVTLPDGSYKQAPFRYQAKCLKALQTAYKALSAGERGRADAVLSPTGGLAVLQGD